MEVGQRTAVDTLLPPSLPPSQIDLALHWDTWPGSWLLGLNWSFINMLLTHIIFINTLLTQ